MAQVLYPTDKIKKVESIFLAGTIDNGNSENWQAEIIKSLSDYNIRIFNPRRKEWDSSWEQKESNPQFNQQVSWELECLEKSDLIVMYFAPNSLSPISLLEMGLFHKKMIVCCPEGFYRKGNVDIVCTRYGIQKIETMESLIEFIKKEL